MKWVQDGQTDIFPQVTQKGWRESWRHVAFSFTKNCTPNKYFLKIFFTSHFRNFSRKIPFLHILNIVQMPYYWKDKEDLTQTFSLKTQPMQRAESFRRCFFARSSVSYNLGTLHKKWSFPLRISSVNVTKSAVSCRFGHIYWRKSLMENFIFCVMGKPAVLHITFPNIPEDVMFKRDASSQTSEVFRRFNWKVWYWTLGKHRKIRQCANLRQLLSFMNCWLDLFLIGSLSSFTLK